MSPVGDAAAEVMAPDDRGISDGAGGALADRVTDLLHGLRRAQVDLPLSAHVDALRVAGAVDLADRRQLREGLAAATLTAAGQRPTFDTLFDLHFPPRRGGADVLGADRDIKELLADLVAAVQDGDDAAIGGLAQEAVDAYGGVENRDGSVSWFAYRVMRQFSTGGLLRRLMAAAELDEGDALAARLVRDGYARRLDDFTASIEAEIRRRTAEQRGVEETSRRAVETLPEDVDFFRIGRDDEAAMRRAVRPLARRLATRLAMRRRIARRGALEPRKTFRRALASGGVPVDLAFRPRQAHKPELVLLCDVSGSVAAFSRFTLLFCHALQGTLSSRVRSFAFIDAVDEVTGYFHDADPADAARRMVTEASLVWLDGHSDYGHAFETFRARHLDALTPRTTLVVLGDARNNYRAPAVGALDALRRRARSVYWLNPEPASQWGSGDSVAPRYGAHVDAMHECRNLRQLAAFVESLG